MASIYESKNTIIQIRQQKISISGLNNNLISIAGGKIFIRKYKKIVFFIIFSIFKTCIFQLNPLYKIQNYLSVWNCSYVDLDENRLNIQS